MPIYEYRCPTCESRFERVEPMSSSSRAVACTVCSGTAGRVVSAVALRGSARPGPTLASLPTSLSGLGGGRETLRHWRNQADRAAAQAAKHPELEPARKRVVSHEGPRGVVFADGTSSRGSALPHGAKPA